MNSGALFTIKALTPIYRKSRRGSPENGVLKHSRCNGAGRNIDKEKEERDERKEELGAEGDFL